MRWLSEGKVPTRTGPASFDYEVAVRMILRRNPGADSESKVPGKHLNPVDFRIEMAMYDDAAQRIGTANPFQPKMARRPLEQVARNMIPLCTRKYRQSSVRTRTLQLLAVWAACSWTGRAEAGLSIRDDAFMRGFNTFAQANAKPARIKPKFTATSSVGLLGTTKIGKFVYELDGCLMVTGISTGASQIIDTVFAANSACSQPGKLEDLILLARYLASVSTDAGAGRASEEPVLQAFKTAEKTHKQQTMAVGPLKFDIGLSNVIGWAMWVH